MTMIERGKTSFLIDGQWGSTGKGKLAGYLYDQHPELTYAISNNMPNAGHTYTKNGKDFIFKVLPIGAAFPGVISLLGPHAAIRVDLLEYEMEMVKNETGEYPTVIIHPMATIVKTEDITEESTLVDGIASTGQGGCSAMVKKIWRRGEANLAKDCEEIKHLIGDTHLSLRKGLSEGAAALAEGSQGFDLSLNCGHSYPHTTSRDCLVGIMVDNCGIPLKSVGSIIASLRTLPIRVGSTKNTSGPFYDDQAEMTWKEVSDLCGYAVEETTTVTKRIRRVFSFSEEQTRKFCEYVQPDYAFLNFVNYYPEGEKRDSMVDYVGSVLSEYGCTLRLLGTGAELEDMIDLHSPCDAAEQYLLWEGQAENVL